MSKPKAYSYIRFSSPEQSKGDSLRRQTELARKYAVDHDLDLDEDLSFRDLGVSGYSGDNLETGRLGDFLAAVQSGHVESGSYLLVESLDRISRKKAREALRLLEHICEAGVAVVTLADGKVYTKDSLDEDPTSLLFSILIFMRAHEESQAKARRVSAAWKNKREKARTSGHKMTPKCPAWLRLNNQGTAYEAIPDRAKLVSRIFTMTLNGYGKRQITTAFNQEGIPVWGKGQGWHPSYIQKILESEAVIGTFQPHILKDKRRIPDGDPIPDYFPAVVEKAVYLQAQAARTERKIPAGKTGKVFSNLFTRLAFCQCGAPMHFENKGYSSKGGAYLVCSNARRGVGDCKRHSWRYSLTEGHILLNLAEVNYQELYPRLSGNTQTVLVRINEELGDTSIRLEQVRRGVENITEAIAQHGFSKALSSQLSALEGDQAALQARHDHLKQEKARQESALASIEGKSGEVEEALWKFVEALADGNNLYPLRAKLHQLLRSRIERIVFKPPLSDQRAEQFGTIAVFFKGDGMGPIRVIHVAANQKAAQGYVEQAGQLVPKTGYDLPSWPPKDAAAKLRFFSPVIQMWSVAERLKRMLIPTT